MKETIKIGTTESIAPGQVKGLTIKDTKILVANVDGRFYAIGSVCTHVGGPLEKGTLGGGAVTCPWHGSDS